MHDYNLFVIPLGSSDCILEFDDIRTVTRATYKPSEPNTDRDQNAMKERKLRESLDKFSMFPPDEQVARRVKNFVEGYLRLGAGD